MVRIVVGLRGEVAMAMRLVIRFDYGRTVPWVWRDQAGRNRRCLWRVDGKTMPAPAVA